MEQTVVEWLFDNLNECFDKFDNGEYSYGDFLNASKEVKEQANKMFEQQIIDAYHRGYANAISVPNKEYNPEKYYNEKFNKDENK